MCDRARCLPIGARLLGLHQAGAQTERGTTVARGDRRQGRWFVALDEVDGASQGIEVP